MTATDEKRNSRDQQIDTATEPEVDPKMFTEDNTNVDYTGVAKKTDPEEIKLVRKLDYMIMVSARSSLQTSPSSHAWQCVNSDKMHLR